MKNTDSSARETVMAHHKHIVILADGDFPTNPHPLDLLSKADTIVCCDNSILKLVKNTNLDADYIVGDMDTMSPENRLKYNEKITRIPDQETNDLTKAFNFSLKLSPSRITILGATGAREDHALANISLLSDYQQQFPNIELVTDHGIFTAHTDTFTLESTPGQQVSIFAFDPTVKIKSAGLVYPTDSVIFDSWWKATLNEASSTQFTLTLNHPAKVLVFRTFA